MMPKPPRGTYLFAAMFLPFGILCAAILLPPIFYAFGFDPHRSLLGQPGYEWLLVIGSLVFLLLCYGVICLARLHPWARGVFLAMLLVLFFGAVLGPIASPPELRTRTLLVRGALALLLIACGLWVLRPSFRAACATYRQARRQIRR